MSNNYYTSPTDVAALTKARASDMNNVDAAVDAAFDKLPTETNIKQGKVNYAVTTGSADAYAVSLPHAPASYTDGLLVEAYIHATNTGAATVNVNSLGVKSIKLQNGDTPAAGDLQKFVTMRYSTTTGFFHIQGNSTTAAAAAAASAVTAATQASTATTQAGIATAQAVIATTQAGIATTKAAEAAASAASIAGGPVASVNGRTGAVTGVVDTGAVTGSGLTMNTARLLGRTTASSGAIEEITVSGATLSGGALTIQSGIGAVSTTSGSSNITLTSGSNGYQSVAMTAMGKHVSLPDATGMTVGGPRFILKNDGGYPFGIRDNAGTLIMGVAAGGIAYVTLKDNSTAAGSWSIIGDNLEPGLITIDSTFSSTYASTVLKPFVALDDNKSIHFAALANGFAAFAVDKTTAAVGTPLTITTTASSVPKHCFKITSTTAIVFYGENSNTLRAAVISLSGDTTLAVGTAATLSATGAAVEDFSGAPKIAQLDSTHYIVSYATATGAGTTSVAALEVTSGTTVTWGAAANIIAANNVINSTTTYALTATTALVLYKSDSPYANNAVVVSVSGTACTVGTPAALTNVVSSADSVPSSCLLSSTKCLVVDNNNGSGTVRVSAFTISGTTVTAGTHVEVETATGVETVTYTVSSATRYNPHLFPLSSSTALLWYLDSGSISRTVVLSESGGTVTAGAISYKNISWDSSGSIGFGVILPQGTTEFCSVNETLASTAGWGLQLLVHKISGTTITPGATKPLSNITQASPASIAATKLSSGDYVLISYGPGSSSPTRCIPVFRTNGDAINYRGEVTCPATRFVPAYPVPAVSSNRVVLLGAQTYGTTVGATTYRLRLISLEIAA